MTEIELGTIECTGDEANNWVSTQLERAGLHVYRSFDLRSARAVDNSCTCSYHGTEACDCQMVVLLVYEGQGTPATLVLHGHGGRTWMSLVEVPHTGLRASITDALAPVHSYAGETC